MALEQLYSHYKQPRTAILMGHARGVICLAAAQAGIPVVHYSATQIKKVLTGNGRAPKSQMQRAIRRELGLAERPSRPTWPMPWPWPCAITICRSAVRWPAPRACPAKKRPRRAAKRNRP